MRYAGIINNDVVNGYDVCVSFWCQGCHFHCPGCHNEHTWNFNGGFSMEDDRLITSIIDLINKNDIQRNLSILGGEPLCAENRAFIYKLIKEVKNTYQDIKVFLWTGYVFESLINEDDNIHSILNQVDIIVDGRFEVDKKDLSLPFRGSSNQRIIDVKKSLNSGDVVECEFVR